MSLAADLILKPGLLLCAGGRGGVRVMNVMEIWSGTIKGPIYMRGLLGKMVQVTFDSSVDLRMLYSLQQETGNLL